MIRIVTARTLMDLRAANEHLRHLSEASAGAAIDARRDAEDARRLADDWRAFAARADRAKAAAERERDKLTAERNAPAHTAAAGNRTHPAAWVIRQVIAELPDPQVRESKVSDILATHAVLDRARRLGDDNLVGIADADYAAAVRDSTPAERMEAMARLVDWERPARAVVP